MRNKLILVVIFIAALLACEKKAAPAPSNKVEPEVKYDYVPPEVILLDSKPKPQVIKIPDKPGGFYIKRGQKIELAPPQKKEAGVFYVMPNYTSADGLALDYVYSGMQDNEGNLWFNTNGGGVSKFDGNTFTIFSQLVGLPNSSVFNLMQDDSGNFWFATNTGVAKYDGIAMITFDTRDGLINNSVHALMKDRSGNMWMGTEGGLSRFDGTSFINYTKNDGLISNFIIDLVQDKNGKIWIGTDAGLSLFDGKSFKNFTAADGFPSFKVLDIYADKEGNLWFGTERGGVSRFDGTSFAHFTAKDGLPSDSIYAILEDKSGIYWFATDKGVSRYDGKAFTTLSTNEGLLNSNVLNILEDRIGNLWFSSAGGGVSRFDGKAFTNFHTAQGLSGNIIRSIYKDSDVYLFGTNSEGLNIYDGKIFTYLSIPQGLTGESIRAIYKDNSGSIWIGTLLDGLSRFDGKSFTNYTIEQGLPSNSVRFFHEDKDGSLWIGTKEGLVKYDGSSFTIYTARQGLVGDDVWSITEDDQGQLWISAMNGVSRFDGKKFTNFLLNKQISSTYKDSQGNLWFSAFGEGVFRYDGISFLNLTTANGLPDNFTYQFTPTAEGYIAIGTNEGFTILKGFKNNGSPIPAQSNKLNSEIEPLLPVFETFNIQTGYPVKDANGGQNSMFLDDDGVTWLGTGSDKTGLVRFDYSALHKSLDPPNIYIKEIKIDNEKVPWYDLQPYKGNRTYDTPPHIVQEALLFKKILSEKEREIIRQKYSGIAFDNIDKFNYVPENLVLPYKNNTAAIEFAAIEPSYPQNVVYQYKMEGLDKDWSPPTNVKNAIYGNMFEGKYTFKLKAKSPWNVWSEPLTYKLRILPPWYRTWLAYLVYASSALTILYTLYKWRTESLRRQKEQLQILYDATERFVPKAFLDLLKKNRIQDIQLGDSAEVELTALFSDIRGFTTLVEQLTPQEAFNFTNTYFKVMAPIIRSHNGFINQFHGDGIMALFPGKADDSIQAVQAMSKALDIFNKAQGTPIHVGYGLNTGMAVIGVLGEDERMEANVISDTINLASRTESLNKYYGTEFLLTDGTIKALADKNKYRIRLVDKVHVKGKTKDTYLYEVNLNSGEDADEIDFIKTYEDAFRFYEKGDIQRALTLFKNAQTLRPENKSVRIFIARSEKLLQTSLPDDWNGVFEMSEK